MGILMNSTQCPGENKDLKNFTNPMIGEQQDPKKINAILSIQGLKPEPFYKAEVKDL